MQLKRHHQWASWNIQSKLLKITADLILKLFETMIGDSMFSIIMDKTNDIRKTGSISIKRKKIITNLTKTCFISTTFRMCFFNLQSLMMKKLKVQVLQYVHHNS